MLGEVNPGQATFAVSGHNTSVTCPTSGIAMLAGVQACLFDVVGRRQSPGTAAEHTDGRQPVYWSTTNPVGQQVDFRSLKTS